MSHPERDPLNERLIELLRILRENPDDYDAFQEFSGLIYEPISKFLFSQLRRRLSYRSDLNELVQNGMQEVFILLLRSGYYFDETGGAKVTTWINAFALNVVRNIARQIFSWDSKITPAETMENYEDIAITETTPDVIEEERKEALMALIHELLDPVDAIIVLAKIQWPTGYPAIDQRIAELDKVEHVDVTKILNEEMKKQDPDWRELSLEAVQKRYRRAIKRLRGELNEEDWR